MDKGLLTAFAAAEFALTINVQGQRVHGEIGELPGTQDVLDSIVPEFDLTTTLGTDKAHFAQFALHQLVLRKTTLTRRIEFAQQTTVNEKRQSVITRGSADIELFTYIVEQLFRRKISRIGAN